MFEPLKIYCIYKQGEKLCVKILRVALFSGAKYKSDKEIVVRFNQACSNILSLNNSTYPVGILSRNDVALTSMRRHHLASTLIRRHFTSCAHWGMCQLISPHKLSDTPVLGDFSCLRGFLSLIMKNVLENLALYRRRGANTSPVSDWFKVFLKNCDKIQSTLVISKSKGP